MFTTGDKLLNIVLERKISIAELSKISGVSKYIILDIMADNKEPELDDINKIAKALNMDVRNIYGNEKSCDEEEEDCNVFVPKDTFFRLVVISTINDMELEKLVHIILEKGIKEYIKKEINE